VTGKRNYERLPHGGPQKKAVNSFQITALVLTSTILESDGVKRMAGKKPNPVDQHVGSRVRLRRMLLGMSQERLGDSMGLTFQQVQKYEKGVNRIGASRLFHISKILDVPVQFFFEEAPHSDGRPAPGMAEPQSEAFILEFLNSREGLELNRAFAKIADAKVRKSVVDLVRALSGGNKIDSTS
jgi:transcriptional regulator with XRE-family HTH domain